MGFGEKEKSLQIGTAWPFQPAKEKKKEMSSQGGVALRDELLYLWGKEGLGEPSKKRSSSPAPRSAWLSKCLHPHSHPPPATPSSWPPSSLASPGVQLQSLIPSPQPLDLFILIQLHTQYDLCKQKITRCNNWILSWTWSLLGCGVDQFPDIQPCSRAPASLSKIITNI